jgi:hypothetical protein
MTLGVSGDARRVAARDCGFGRSRRHVRNLASEISAPADLHPGASSGPLRPSARMDHADESSPALGSPLASVLRAGLYLPGSHSDVLADSAALAGKRAL